MENNYFSKIAKKGIRPSVQRIAVYKYLCEHPDHPTVDMVYTALFPDYPTLSRTTVYNTLKLLTEHGLVRTIQLEEDKLRYDATTVPHIHFKCMECGKIQDIYDEEFLSKITSKCTELLPEGSVAGKIQTCIWGRCNKCASKK
ncbi:transcriptional repressor [Treponema parvum]|uniref:Transcriptional repressor n=1 Tax=Treponema parvum TaxID=138851 RepID=A0A975IFH1_9SPIR|nr:Fur family transcriptional regulator [Treponema parvum]QTQ14339.1 transcriptional repressor [Treponema parvum]